MEKKNRDNSKKVFAKYPTSEIDKPIYFMRI